jgi:hypothetical protein
VTLIECAGCDRAGGKSAIADGNFPTADQPTLRNPCPFERSRWRGGRCACDTPGIMGCRSVLNRLSPRDSNSISIYMLRAKIDLIPID